MTTATYSVKPAYFSDGSAGFRAIIKWGYKDFERCPVFRTRSMADHCAAERIARTSGKCTDCNGNGGTDAGECRSCHGMGWVDPRNASTEERDIESNIFQPQYAYLNTGDR